MSPIRNASGRIVGASKIARDITERKEAEARQELLTRELHHRTKNLFAVVQAVVSRSFAGKRTVEEAQDGRARPPAFARPGAHPADREGMAGHQICWSWSRERDAPLQRPRGRSSGPPLVLSPQAAQSFALALHELATNAAKYGALSVPGGRVVIGWSVDSPNGSGQFTFHWQERDGPPVSPPQHKGFGSTVLEQVMAEYANTPPQDRLFAERCGL